MTLRVLLALACPALLSAQAASENLNAVLWTQTAVEYAATSIQTYRAAEQSLARAIKDVHWTAALEQTAPFGSLPPAVILDLDETVLDNSAMQARLIRQNLRFTNDIWTKWVAEERAGLVPGALQFLAQAHAKGVDLFYVTNRVCKPADPSDPTVRVIRRLHIPLEEGHLLCRATSSGDKGARRAGVAAAHRVLLVIGDDFNDFMSIDADRNTVEGRATALRAFESYWGERWFMLANPMYGSWERAVGLDLNSKLTHLRP
jgi:5'-nucleotidase (lipoprotein e(P4) family)